VNPLLPDLYKSVQSFIKDFKNTIKFAYEQGGWKGVLIYFTHPLIQIQDGFLFQRSLAEPVEIITARIQLEIRKASIDDLQGLSNFVSPLRMRRLERKMREGEICFIGIHDGSVIAMIWTAFPGTPTSNELPFHLNPGEAYYWGAYCLPEFRSQGVIQSVGSILGSYLRERGFQFVYLLTLRHNKQMLAIFKKNKDYKKIRRLISIRILKWRWQRYIPYNKA
jgi:ribosomal protein S18 acetylase RimI-like enzyme